MISTLGRSRLVLATTFGAILGAAITLALVAGPDTSKTAPKPLAGAAALLQPGSAAAHYPSVDLADIAEASTPSVVNISSTRVSRSSGRETSPFLDDPFFRHFFQLPPGQGIPQERRSQSLGSGVIVSSDGVVLTNNHVIEGAEEIRVALADNREFDAELVGADPQSDIAVLRLRGKASGLKAMRFGDSSALRLGETVLAIGNPFGVGQTVTMGIVSATGRANVGIAAYEDFIQTDAAINPGNSGGALINTKGELVGINTAIVSRSGGYQGVGLAIPSNMVGSIMTSLVEKGRVVRGWLGVSIQAVDRDLAEALGVEQARGVLVADVTADGPAEKAGIQRGDVIISVDGQEIRSTGELRNRIASRQAGSEAKVEVLRDGKRRTITVKLGELPETVQAEDPAPAATSGLLGGVTVADLNPETRRRFEVPRQVESGAVVAELEPRSAAAKAGLAPGDVILEVNRTPVKNAADFRRAAAAADGNTALLLLARQGGTAFVLVKK